MNKTVLPLTIRARRVWRQLLPRRKIQIAVLALLMLLATLAEVVSISAVIPFLVVLASPEIIYEHEVARPLIELIGLESPQELPLPVTTLFICAAILAGITRVVLLWGQTRLSTSIGTDFSVQVYERTLHQTYATHIARNSSEILAGAQKAKEISAGFVQPLLVLVSGTLILLAITLALLALEPVATLIAFMGFGTIYSALIVHTRRRIEANSELIAHFQVGATKAIQEGLGGIRDVLIDGSQGFFCKLYRESFVPMQRAIAANKVISAWPRFGVEALGISLIAALAYMMVVQSEGENKLANVTSVLGLIALGAQRMLPTMQQIYSSYISLTANQSSTDDVLGFLEQPMSWSSQNEASDLIDFKERIYLSKVGFKYHDSNDWVFRNLSVEIKRGSIVGLVGSTGSGKSTLLDIVMGLLCPTEGTLYIDDVPLTQERTRAWQRKIAHVPQTIFLADTSVAENIAFGVPQSQIDLDSIKNAARRAQISSVIESWPDGYSTRIGERGIRLSGGQRQRLGIARALYKNATMLILDEATSALDEKTELSVMQALDACDDSVTLIIIAHRLTTLKNCTQIFELSPDGGIISRDFKNLCCEENFLLT